MSELEASRGGGIRLVVFDFLRMMNTSIENIGEGGGNDGGMEKCLPAECQDVRVRLDVGSIS